MWGLPGPGIKPVAPSLAGIPAISPSLLIACHHTENQAHVPHVSRTLQPGPCSRTGHVFHLILLCMTHQIPCALIRVDRPSMESLALTWASFLNNLLSLLLLHVMQVVDSKVM